MNPLIEEIAQYIGIKNSNDNSSNQGEEALKRLLAGDKLVNGQWVKKEKNKSKKKRRKKEKEEKQNIFRSCC